jgi:hypothetical protein
VIWLLGFLACYRLTRLFTADEITKPIRIWAHNRNPWAGYLISCDWCLSIWLAPLIAIPLTQWPENPLILVLFASLGLSAVTGLLSTIEERINR